MIKSVRKAAPFVLALSLALVGAAFAGDNAGATFSLVGNTTISGVGPGQTVTVEVAGAGLVNVKQIDIYLAVSPASAFDLTSVTYSPPSGFIVPGAPSVVGTDTVRAGSANFTAGLTGSSSLGTITLTTSASLTTTTQATISVGKISIGPSSSTRDVFQSSAIGLSVTVNPPAPPVIEPLLTASTATDIMADFSAVGAGSASNASAGEVTLGVSFTDNTSAAKSGQSITWTIVNNGGERVYVLAPSATQVAAGAQVTVTGTTSATGAASLLLDSEGGKTAAATSVAVTAATTAPNSEGVSSSLSVAFSVNWDVPVPAELASFAGQITANREVLLTWGVASQSSNLGWEVFRSVNGVQYERVSGLIPGEGTTDVYRTYQFVDSAPPTADVVYYYLRQTDLDGTTTRSQTVQVAYGPTAVEQGMLPAVTSLAQNFPNPFNPETTIRFDLSEGTAVTITVYDATGQAVRTLANGEFMAAGTYNLRWDGRNAGGAPVGSGIYFYELKAGSFTSMKKMTLLQ